MAMSRREFLCDSVLAGAGVVASFGGESAGGQSKRMEGQRSPNTLIDMVVSINGSQPDWLMNQAVQVITHSAKRWASVDLKVVTLSDGLRELPSSPGVVLTTLDRLRKVAPGIELSNPEVMRVSFLNEQGFACVPVRSNGNLHMLVVGRTVRGVFNGAVYLRDFCIDAREGRLYLQPQTIVRTPQMSGRPVYLLTIWNEESRYTASDWERIFDSFIRDGIDTVYFWVSGHFPSKKFPQTYKVAEGQADSTTHSGIGTLEDQHRIIRAAHERGLKIYLGGGLGAWAGTRFLTNLRADTMKTPSKDAPTANESLCPSHPLSRKALIEYYTEMFDALADADGLYIESADESGKCSCALCDKSIDSLGSKQYGQSQLTIIQTIMSSIWRDHPHARLAYSIGYPEHKNDPAYYQVVRQMSDQRIEWMETRNSWEFPGPSGKNLPAPYFSRRVMIWKYDDLRPLEELIEDVSRAAKLGWYGCIATFSPGFASGSFYHEIPFPTDSLPYVLTSFVLREATWEPSLTVEDMRERVQDRFFGKDSSEDGLGNDLWTLREMIRTTARAKKMTTDQSAILTEIEQRVERAGRRASPKAQESLATMRRAITDIRNRYDSETKNVSG